MTRKRSSKNALYYETLGLEILRAVDTEAASTERDRKGSFLSHLIDPVLRQNDVYRHTGMYLAGALKAVPIDEARAHADAFADDLRAVTVDEAIERLMDKLSRPLMSGRRGVSD